MQDVIGSVYSNGLEDLSRSWAGFMAWMFALLSEVRGRIYHNASTWFPTRSWHKYSFRFYSTRPLCKTTSTSFLKALGIIILQPPVRAFLLLSLLWQATKQLPLVRYRTLRLCCAKSYGRVHAGGALCSPVVGPNILNMLAAHDVVLDETLLSLLYSAFQSRSSHGSVMRLWT